MQKNNLNTTKKKNTKRWFSTVAVVFLTCIGLQSNARADDYEKLIRKYGFQFETNRERPWSRILPNMEALSWLESKEFTYLVDPKVFAKEYDVDELIKADLRTYAANEVGLITEMFIGPATPYKFDLAKVRIRENRVQTIYRPPLHAYRAELADIVIEDKKYHVSCLYKLLEKNGNYYVVLRERRLDKSDESIFEPSCDLTK
jgi:hypothetical protein